MDIDFRQRQGEKAVNIGLGANIVLAVLKTTIGVIASSPALLAEGINSTSDTAYYLVVSVFMRLSRKPADEAHPFGHGQLESIAALVVGSFVITTAIAIFWDAVTKVYAFWRGSSDYVGTQSIALVIALLTVLAKSLLTVYTSRVGHSTENPAVLALASDHRNDIFSAAGAAVGIFLSQIGILWGDPLAGALVALVILRTGLEIMRDSSHDLMDAVPSETLARRIQKLLRSIPGVLHVEEVHAHRFGPYLVVNLTIGVEGGLSVVEGDQIASQVEQALFNEIDYLGRVHIHYHPAQFAANEGNQDALPQHLLMMDDERETVLGDQK